MLNLLWVVRIYIYMCSAFRPRVSCLRASTSCLLMYARCAFARPVWSDFWRPCLISWMCVYFYTYSSAADFSPIDVVIDSEGFYNSPQKPTQEFQWLCNLGGMETRGGGGRTGGGGDLKVLLVHLRKRGHASVAVISIVLRAVQRRRGERQAALLFLFRE